MGGDLWHRSDRDVRDRRAAVSTPLDASHLAGVRPAFSAAVFFLLDRGQYREGGWNYTIWWGVWPQVLSTGFTFLYIRLRSMARSNEGAPGILPSPG
jgi:hypothetical protein